MAENWIKMRKTLLTDPKVIRIASALKTDRLRTVGAVMSAWCLFDDQTETGFLDGYTPELFDELICCPGLALAMASVSWLEIGDGFLSAPRFKEHNGQTAKRRAQDAARKSAAREADKSPPPARTETGPDKIRQDKKSPTDSIPAVPEESQPAGTGKSRNPDMEALQRRINGLKPEWQKPVHWNATEQHELHGGTSTQLLELTADEWILLGRYLNQPMPDGANYWQPRNRAKFVETFSSVFADAQRWAGKTGNAVKAGPTGGWK